MLEHSADFDGELLAALATLLEAVTGNAFRVLLARLAANARQVIDATADRAAVRAGNSIGPNDALKKLESLGLVVELGLGKNRHGKCSVDEHSLPH